MPEAGRRRTGRLMLRLRQMSQALVLVIVGVLLVIAAVPGSPTLVWLFHLDPLATLSVMIQNRITPASLVWPTAAVVLVTVLLGRVFCGWFCPLGALIDLWDRLLGRTRSMGQSFWRWPKYAILTAIGVSALIGAPLAFLFDPFGILVRSFTWLLSTPLAVLGRTAGSQPWGGVLAQSPALAPEVAPALQGTLWGALSLAVVLGLSFGARRGWCRSVCPLGAFLGLLSRFALLRREVTQNCTNCRLCSRDCKMGAIPDDPRTTHVRECIQCWNCVPVCRNGSARIAVTRADTGSEAATDMSRRRLVGAAAAGFLWSGAWASDSAGRMAVDGRTPLASPWLIRPPGARAETAFNSACIRCGLCLRVCPTSGLQPAVTQAGMDGFWTPVLVPRIGYCAEHCNRCGEVCPTAAIRLVDVAAKRNIRIGQAYIDRSKCIVWAQGKECLVCDEHCSYRAIDWISEGKQRNPVVMPEVCTGCGQCENRCPVQPDAAIRVISLGESRHAPASH